MLAIPKQLMDGFGETTAGLCQRAAAAGPRLVGDSQPATSLLERQEKSLISFTNWSPMAKLCAWSPTTKSCRTGDTQGRNSKWRDFPSCDGNKDSTWTVVGTLFDPITNQPMRGNRKGYRCASSVSQPMVYPGDFPVFDEFRMSCGGPKKRSIRPSFFKSWALLIL